MPTKSHKYSRGKAFRIPVIQAPSPKAGMRIRIPQPSDRPLIVRPLTAVRKELVRQNLWWSTARRRWIRPKIGEDPLEARAVSRESVRGTLPERIVWKFLFDMRISYDFQSSLAGGRMEAGGCVADFIVYPYEKNREFVLNIQGPTHDDFLRKAKDEEQRQILESMGFKVYEIEEETIYDVYAFEDYMRRLLGLAQGFGGGGGAFSAEEWRHEATELDGWQMNIIYEMAIQLNAKIDAATTMLYYKGIHYGI